MLALTFSGASFGGAKRTGYILPDFNHCGNQDALVIVAVKTNSWRTSPRERRPYSNLAIGLFTIIFREIRGGTSVPVVCYITAITVLKCVKK